MNESYESTLTAATNQEFSRFKAVPSDQLPPLLAPKTTALERLASIIHSGGGRLLCYHEGSDGAGAAIAAFPQGIRLYKSKPRREYHICSDLSWNVLAVTKNDLGNYADPA
jgi:hypothetical protein